MFRYVLPKPGAGLGVGGILWPEVQDLLARSAYFRARSSNLGLMSRDGMLEKLKSDSRKEVESKLAGIIKKHEVQIIPIGNETCGDALYSESEINLRNAIADLNRLCFTYSVPAFTNCYIESIDQKKKTE